MNLGRFLTRWLFKWEQIWNDKEARNQVNQELGNWKFNRFASLVRGCLESIKQLN
ncbi:hypothetical protein [Umezakia ovalisporum]|uniref:Uncharacterized protein n=1 Tax=Umezakia ovalisporum FSS-62 TaxID=2971776 RepID=A0AA43KEP8_9CYAN|nr:hypothetical protein [Umezakia ovalisporum]MDH6063747.1 hypothetical protein [Umezakia ovalisporum FSS-62]MDH6068015.1 hypothetical protein [Umezakia ovalisporum APH033B]MDH6075338.1 hypothetical protein [Umezakia ovalisporum CS-1034]MDH6079652.1 hypothetical protein [Umezakia ovalisporum FSS-45]MDH6082391.1 hypothetical protein [Umezakia ovalisporum FSS-44]